MSIKITNQTNENECGCCVIASLHNHFFNKNIAKIDVLEKTEISEKGLSLLEFESLCDSFDIKAESYEVNWNEFKNFNYHGYFVMLIQKNNNYHYCIFKKNKRKITIFDSLEGKKEFELREIEKIFTGILIFVHKKSQKTKINIEKMDYYNFIDIKFVAISSVINITIIMTSIILANFINSILGLAIESESITNLITLIFFYGIIYLIKNSLEFINHIFYHSNTTNTYFFFKSNYLNKLSIKNQFFYKKFNLNWLFQMDTCIMSISQFITQDINNIIADIFLLFVTTTVLAILMPLTLLIISLIIFYKIIFLFIKLNKQKQILKDLANYDNRKNKLYAKLINNLTNQINYEIKNNIIIEMKNNLSNISIEANNTTIFSANYLFFDKLLTNFIYILSIAILSYLFIKNKEDNIGKLMLILSLIELNKDSIDGSTNFILSKEKYKFYFNIYQEAILVENLIKNNNKIKFDKTIKIIEKNNNSIELVNGKYISINLLEIINDSKYSIILDKNNNNINSTTSLNKEIIFVDSNFVVDPTMIYIDINQKIYHQIIKELKIDINNIKNDLGKILFLLSKKDKWIIIDLKQLNINIKEQEFFQKKIMRYLETYNFVTYVGQIYD